MNKKMLTFRLDLRSRLPTLESYRPISNLPARCDASDQRRKGRSKTIASQDFVSYVDKNEEGINSCENLFSNQRQIHSNLEKREEAHRKNLTASGLLSKRVKFQNDRNIRSYCEDAIN